MICIRLMYKYVTGCLGVWQICSVFKSNFLATLENMNSYITQSSFLTKLVFSCFALWIGGMVNCYLIQLVDGMLNWGRKVKWLSFGMLHWGRKVKWSSSGQEIEPMLPSLFNIICSNIRTLTKLQQFEFYICLNKMCEWVKPTNYCKGKRKRKTVVGVNFF